MFVVMSLYLSFSQSFTRLSFNFSQVKSVFFCREPETNRPKALTERVKSCKKRKETSRRTRMRRNLNKNLFRWPEESFYSIQVIQILQQHNTQHTLD